MKRPRGLSDRKRASTRILIELQNLDEARHSLITAFNDLTRTVNDSPENVRADFREFWARGGCSLEQYRGWISGNKLSLDPVLRRQHLRLVADRPKAEPASPPRSPSDTPKRRPSPSIGLDDTLDCCARPIPRYRDRGRG
jgi:hypothetical protein